MTRALLVLALVLAFPPPVIAVAVDTVSVMDTHDMRCCCPCDYYAVRILWDFVSKTVTALDTLEHRQVNTNYVRSPVEEDSLEEAGRLRTPCRGGAWISRDTGTSVGTVWVSAEDYNQIIIPLPRRKRP